MLNMIYLVRTHVTLHYTASPRYDQSVKYTLRKNMDSVAWLLYETYLLVSLGRYDGIENLKRRLTDIRENGSVVPKTIFFQYTKQCTAQNIILYGKCV